jgi:2-polyprenyl-3-methyl-5-hydroxy-6-metoxy-1,4-benzoquinol methylase
MSAVCPVCDAAGAVALGSKGGHEYLRCASCRLIFAARMPSPEEFAASYGKYGVRRLDWRKVLRKKLKLWPLVLLGKRRLREARPLRFLDIGSNTGYNTEAARQLGCEAHGLETNPGTIAMARKEFPACVFHEKTIEQLATEGLVFDVVYCSEVLEHVPEPKAFMAAIAKVCAPGCLLFLTTPDSAHWRVPADVLSWKEVIPVQHLRLYDRANLSRLLAAHGFEVDFFTPMLRANMRLYCSKARG